MGDGQTRTGRTGQCLFCDEFVYEDRDDVGGGLDWGTEDGDYGCDGSPLNGPDGTGGHLTLDAARDLVVEFERAAAVLMHTENALRCYIGHSIPGTTGVLQGALTRIRDFWKPPLATKPGT